MAHFTFEFYPKALARKVKADLVVPSMNLHECLKNTNDNYYCQRNEKFPLIIFLCGFGDNEKAWQINTPIISLCEKNHIAACFINGENKWYHNMGPIDDYYSFIERDLLDFLYGNFSSLSKIKPLIICGVSMGGYGALYHYLKNIEKYDACIALSPATKPDYLDETKFGTLRDLFMENKNRMKKIYLSVGENDFIIDASKELDQYLITNSLGANYKYIPGHSWNTWNKEVYEVIDYLKENGLIGE
jgi:putative tributyrin esterase